MEMPAAAAEADCRITEFFTCTHKLAVEGLRAAGENWLRLRKIKEYEKKIFLYLR